MTYKPKLIEVALPLAAINEASAREKSIRHGHPSTLHLWWARRPLAAARAVIWASLVDDPSGDPTLTPVEQDERREELFTILKKLIRWESSNDPVVLREAEAEIHRCFPDGPPAILDPFGGGGAIPLEAQRLGLTALSGDLNPVAVLIQKAMLEIPPRFARQHPIHPDLQQSAPFNSWARAQGLAADIHAYGQWMRDEAEMRIGSLYPDATGPDGEQLTPIAWVWARTVESPDPSWDGHVPLVASWTLAQRPGKPTVWIEPIIDRPSRTIRYRIREGGKPSLRETVDRGGGYCVATGAAMPFTYIRDEGQAGRMGTALLAVVCEGRGRIYVEASGAHVASANVKRDIRLGPIPVNGRDFKTPNYGMHQWEDLFSSRQLTALSTFSELLGTVHARIRADAEHAGLADDGIRFRDGGSGAAAYADCSRDLSRIRDRQVRRLLVDDLQLAQLEGTDSEHVRPPGHSDDVGLRGVQPVLGVDGKLDGHGRVGPEGRGASPC